MKLLSLLLVAVALSACSHDDKPAVTADNTTADGGAAASSADGGGAATDPSKDPCAAVRCRGGMVCKVVDGAPTCVQN